jgi:hypothetical protein
VKSANSYENGVVEKLVDKKSNSGTCILYILNLFVCLLFLCS